MALLFIKIFTVFAIVLSVFFNSNGYTAQWDFGHPIRDKWNLGSQFRTTTPETIDNFYNNNENPPTRHASENQINGQMDPTVPRLPVITAQPVTNHNGNRSYNMIDQSPSADFQSNVTGLTPGTSASTSSAKHSSEDPAYFKQNGIYPNSFVPSDGPTPDGPSTGVAGRVNPVLSNASQSTLDYIRQQGLAPNSVVSVAPTKATTTDTEVMRSNNSDSPSIGFVILTLLVFLLVGIYIVNFIIDKFCHMEFKGSNRETIQPSSNPRQNTANRSSNNVVSCTPEQKGKQLADMCIKLVNDDYLSKAYDQIDFGPTERNRFRFYIILCNMAHVIYAINAIDVPNKQALLDAMFKEVSNHIHQNDKEVRIGDLIMNQSYINLIDSRCNENTLISYSTVFNSVLNHISDQFVHAICQEFQVQSGAGRHPLDELFMRLYTGNENYRSGPFPSALSIVFATYTCILTKRLNVMMTLAGKSGVVRAGIPK